ncbi:NTF2 fold immunity protein [Chryseobacterium sp. CCH4-E10]|uniref:NTF2 fold immunity protein n=1 Tax=Chryseobacterium sp. CCH4-E10 TaxID=1768758 RepID=UPI000831A4EF|nr:NTF2 fold immunity protein [Chryseobacterium sp. CCH4-E10]
MKHYLLIIFLILFSCSKNKSKINGSDQDIAIKLAEEVWIKAYGKSEIKEQKPFVAKKKNDSIWVVHGTFNKTGFGGVAYAEVNVKKQKVITYTHGE